MKGEGKGLCIVDLLQSGLHDFFGIGVQDTFTKDIAYEVLKLAEPD